MTKTENYNLNQWEPEDPVRRADFNGDNAKIDAALDNLDGAISAFHTELNAKVDTVNAVLDSKINTTANSLAAQISAADNATNQKFDSSVSALSAAVAQKCQVVIGSYEGDGAASKTISLGARPKAVFVYPKGDMVALFFNTGTDAYGGLALDGSPYTAAGVTTVAVVNSGFTVYYASHTYTNSPNRTFHYIAFF